MIEKIQYINDLKSELDKFRPLDNHIIQQALDIEYTYESNKIEGNTFSLQETQLVIEKGLTISEKPLSEHLEVINHKEAIDFIKDIVKNNIDLDLYVLKQIHGIILKSIDKNNAGKFRNIPVMISGTTFIPPNHYLLDDLMQEYFLFYNENKTKIHPVILSAEMHERLVTIHPFSDGNGRTARLVMNLILLKNGFPIANIKGDSKSRLNYYSALEQAQIYNNKTYFINLVLENVEDSLKNYLKILK